jgi:hypothetical protein
MARRPQPGLSFSLVCDLGFAVGLMTHDVPRMGSLIWIAERTFDDAPSAQDVESIDRWRWPIFFPLSVAIHRKIVTPIGIVPIPEALRSFPVMRGGNRQMGWTLTDIPDGSLPSRPLGPATDPSVPIYEIVNDTRLKEMIVAGWRPEDDW